ncbi:class I SAM-dependent methyltransferase [bacterium]|nr:class I SAM-dependent methyltransferase [bacterium]
MKLKRNKQNDVWNKIYENYNKDSNNSYFHNRLISIINHHINNKTRVLEVGFGSGSIVSYFQNKTPLSVGLDFNINPIKIAKNIFKAKNLVQGDVFSLPFKNDSFDVVWNEGMLEHWKFNKSHIAIEEMKRVSKKYIIIAIPNRYSIWIIRKLILKVIGKWRFGYEESYSIRRLKKLFKLSHLEIVDTKGVQIFFGSLTKRDFFAKLSEHIENNCDMLTKHFAYEIVMIGKVKKY